MTNVIKINRPYNSNLVRSMSQTIIRQIGSLEKKNNNLMHYFNSDLEKRAMAAINTKDTIRMEKIIKELNELL